MTTLDRQIIANYPLAPWHLNGQLYGSIWSLSPRHLNVELPPEFRLLVNLGRASAFVGFVDYQPGSSLVYRELIAGVVVNIPRRVHFAFNITHIWVDSELSKQGGRELWGVPKELADFDFQYQRANLDFKATARIEGQTLANGDFKAILGMPQHLRMPVPFPNLQMLHGQPHRSSGTFHSSLQLSGSGMEIPVDSPLAALGVVGRKPLISFGGLNFKMNLQAAQLVKL